MRHHVTCTIPTRTDGLEISRYHFVSHYAATTYKRQLDARPPYHGEVAECDDPSCTDFDITSEAAGPDPVR